jgi:hypothetical protein
VISQLSGVLDFQAFSFNVRLSIGVVEYVESVTTPILEIMVCYVSMLVAQNRLRGFNVKVS